MSVGLSFGTATSGQGIDVSSTVAQMVSSMQAVETPWKSRLTTLESKDTAISSLGTSLSTVATDLEALTNTQSSLETKEGSSSDTSILTLTSATSTAATGSHAIIVSKLAQTASAASGIAASTSDLLSGSVIINGTEVSVDSTKPNLANLVDAINDADLGVTATLITDTKGSRISLVSNTDGAAGAFTVSGTLTDTTSGADISFSTVNAGNDAELSVDGVNITSASNTVTDAISGVTLQLLKADKDTQVQVQITNSTSTALSALYTFVTDYNTLVSAMNAQEGKDSSGNYEPLFGSTVLMNLQQSLQDAINFTQKSGLTSLSAMGLDMQADGTISIDSDTLTSAINSNYKQVVSFFQGTSGFGLNLSTALVHLGTSSTYGVLALALTENSTQEADLNSDISRQEALISTQETRLTDTLNNVNLILQEIPSQLNEISQIYSAITGYGKSS